ncbi:MAG: SCP2 sterol-binding domain-containing protein [Promethearchaeota archaeon]
MRKAKIFDSIISELEEDDEKFITIFKKLIKFGISIIENNEELQEEIMDYDEVVQNFLIDIDFNFWFKISKGKIEHFFGINKDASIRITLTRAIMIKIIKGETLGSDAYMRGLIKADGDLSIGLRYIKILRSFFNFMEKKTLL